MTVTVTYDFDILNEAQDLSFGSATAAADLTGLANGGFAGVGNNAGSIFGTIFGVAGTATATFSPTIGTNGAIDQLYDGELVVVSQDADSIRFRVVDSVSGAELVASTDLNLPGSTNADVTALTTGVNDFLGGFFVVYQTSNGANSDINYAIRSSNGAFRTAGAIDATAANDTDAVITQLDGGNVAVAWMRTVAGETEVWYAIHTGDGAVVKGPTLLDTAGAQNSHINITALNGGGFALVYEDSEWGANTNVTLARLDSAGNNAVKFNISDVRYIEDDPSVTRLANGMLAVALVIHTLTFVKLVDPATGVVLAVRDVADAPVLGSNPVDPTVTGFGTGRVAVIYSDAVGNFSGGQAQIIVRTSVGNSHFGGPGDTMNGDDFVDHMTGGFGDDTLNGGGNNDVLNGSAGVDTINGGDGDDLIYGGYNGNLIGGAYQGDVIDGGAGNDRIFAFSEDNPDGEGFFVGDIIHGGAGDDFLRGSFNADTLFGDADNDILNGGLGGDAMNGGTGNDTYYVDDAGDTTSETGGGGTGDYVFASVSFAAAAGIERLYLTGTGSINATGANGQNDILVGNSGNNVLNGLTGNDLMRGGLGNDTYYVDSVSDTTDEVTGGGGTGDYVYSSVSFTAAQGIERLYLTGLANVNATGRAAQNDILVGNSGNNILNGLSGNDVMRGGLGNDTYYVDSISDSTDEVTGGGGSDFIYSSVSFTASQGIERLYLTGAGNINGTGRDAQNDILGGNTGNNVLSGLTGLDTLIGGLGNDTLTGGTGADTFRFDTALNAATNMDTITDFVAVDDLIQLENAVFTALTITGTLAAGAFNTGTAATQADDRIIYNTVTGALLYDADGLGGAAGVQFALLSTHPAGVSAADFLVY